MQQKSNFSSSSQWRFVFMWFDGNQNWHQKQREPLKFITNLEKLKTIVNNHVGSKFQRKHCIAIVCIGFGGFNETVHLEFSVQSPCGGLCTIESFFFFNIQAKQLFNEMIKQSYDSCFVPFCFGVNQLWGDICLK